jgi:hypothetical protein
MTAAVRHIAPAFNRCVIFSTQTLKRFVPPIVLDVARGRRERTP